MHRKTTDFCILMLYQATLSNSIIVSESCLVENLGLLNILSYHLYIVAILFLPSSLDAFYFFCLSDYYGLLVLFNH